jgi:adenylylsulfate kinase
MDCSLDVLVERDVKGLYKKALAGEIANFTGVSDPYEPPLCPELTLRTAVESPEDSAAKVLAYVDGAGSKRPTRSSPASGVPL